MESTGVPTGASGFAPVNVPPTAGRVASPTALTSAGGPNPSVAGILAGFFPFGVGAVYTGQFAKGLAHLVIFVLLVAGASASDRPHGEILGIICGLGIAFFYVYQIIDAVRSAKALQLGQSAPDPFGLAATFGGGAKSETTRIPVGAIVLILLGVIFLLHTLGLMEYGIDRFWPVLLIGLGGWLFARNWGLLGPSSCAGCQCARCRTRRLMGPAVLLTIGVLFLLENLRLEHLGFSHTWPLILLVIGGTKLLQGSASTQGHVTPIAPGAIPPGAGFVPSPPAVTPAPPTPTSALASRPDHPEVHNG